MTFKINKRAQEEIVGFVIIVLLVSVVALIFFGISLRKTSPVDSSIRLENFLEAAVKTTTNCSIKKIPDYLDLSELVKECKKQTKCYDGRDACKALNETIGGLMEETFRVSNETPTSYYSVKTYYVQNTSQTTQGLESFYSISKGKCEGIKNGNTLSISALPGVIRLETQICQRTAKTL